ncbi:adenomatous polyposis coli protein [Nasonia vitripennis]|uniref:Uncharacterized protein n=1 Tax=Nasonia vitripennis TaxID=7425 RepID=A0A7M7IVN8_NASVI|nr:adenomatous polyposis coli protein [Nasonia vitripennis]XP_016845588.1 adenomatous polyposis coli protein [Nasonia vitripennis]
MTTRVARHASKKAPTSVNLSTKLCYFSNFIETDFDQTTNYSLLYAEENSVIEEVGHFDYLAGGSEQENTITTYYTEGTPFETPPHFSTSTSTSDLLKLDDTRLSYTLQADFKELITDNQTTELIREKLEKLNEIDQLQSYMEFENKEKECESTDINIYLPDDLEDFDDKCDEEPLERIINVTPSQSPVELCDKDREGKMVTFGGEDRYSHQTPLMFSRCSSLGSLSGYEQQSLHDDRSSVVSDFSRRTSEAVSPSELPDSPAQFVHPGSTQQRDKKSVRKKSQQMKDKVQSPETFSAQPETSKRSIFEDDLAVFKEESTPIRFQSVAASSLSSLTIDDDDEADEQDRGEMKNKAGIIKSSKVSTTNNQFESVDETERRKPDNNVESLEENSYFSVDEEKILEEYIRKGIAKVTRQDINDVSSFNLQDANAYDSSENKTHSSLELFDEASELTAEEEKLLDECIRRGIAKVTRQNIDDVTSLSLRSNISGLSTISSFNKDNNKQEKEQQKHEEPKKRTAVCQME